MRDQQAAEPPHQHLEPLMTFLHVARLGRYTAAADVLRVNHSTVSRRIAALERSLGGRVLARTPSGWEVTALGQRVLAAAERVEDALASLSGDGEQAGRISGVVRLGSPDAFAVHVATPALAGLQRASPNLAIELISATQRARQTRSGLDLEIVVGRPQVHRAQAELVMDYALGLYATEDYLQRHGRPRSIAELAGHRLNYYVEAVLTIDDLDRATEALPAMRRGIASTNVLSHVTATTAGAGVGLLPNYVADHEPRLRRLLAEEYAHDLSYWAVGRQEALRNPAVQAVYAALRQRGQRMEDELSR
ncbi:LysR family transcriptional regulator [Nesterenkonia sp. HG001]|uniref:LysR family transcriptional regulator n=1 Tax=Nesterenkonia sp. HG001 TaxID=2983207 RepID=UPI002AC68ED8|nr:LysR family transcriptional regulator [Nesterenkonia sp. HG001]MDZ5077481.1 LysR family transcriptional regulator [Nesterenkonia sp. HG001]